MKKLIPILVALCLMIVIGLSLIGKEIVDRYSYSKERVDMDAYYNVSGDNCAILFEDQQLEEYALVKLTREQLAELDPAAVAGRKVTPYGAQAMVRRDRIPPHFVTEHTSLEDIILFLAQAGGSKQ